MNNFNKLAVIITLNQHEIDSVSGGFSILGAASQILLPMIPGIMSTFTAWWNRRASAEIAKQNHIASLSIAQIAAVAGGATALYEGFRRVWKDNDVPLKSKLSEVAFSLFILLTMNGIIRRI